MGYALCMSEERVVCQQCGKWRFHLAVTCPHCGARSGDDGAKPADAKPPAAKPELKLSAEEARALLAASSLAQGPAPASLGDVASDLVMPRAGGADLVLTVLAAPLTVATVVVLGYLLVRERRSRREGKLEGARLFGVPAVGAFIAVTLWTSSDVPSWSWALLGGSFAAWGARELLRASARKDPLL